MHVVSVQDPPPRIREWSRYFRAPATNLYIADTGNERIRKVSKGIITTVAGDGTYGDNGPATGAQLYLPPSVAVDAAGNLYIADSNNRVRKVSKGIITTVAGHGRNEPNLGNNGDNGPATSAGVSPFGVAADAMGNIYVATFIDGIRKVSDGIITTVVSGSDLEASNIAVDSSGALYVAENNRIRKFSKGAITTVAGDGASGFSGDNGLATGAKLNFPSAVTVNAVGDLYIADTSNHRIRKVSKGVITTVAGNGTSGFSGDNGLATSAALHSPCAVAVDAVGNLYIADTGNNRVRKVSKGVITTLAGNGKSGFSGDNGPGVNAQLSGPYGIAVDARGNVYIADTGNSRIRVLTIH